jgi:hypothetical protein
MLRMRRAQIEENLGPAFMRLVPEVLAYLERAGAQPGMMVAWYAEPSEDGAVVVYAGFDIDAQAVNSDERSLCRHARRAQKRIRLNV